MSAPYERPGWSALGLSERNDQMRDWHNERFIEKMEARGYVVLTGYMESAIEWCTSCDCELERGRDSYGDCADCGERVVWVRRVDTSPAKET